MLLELNIENFALIEKLNIHFDNQLNILTGETGAGKSIIIDAVTMGIGERADKDYVRTGFDKSIIQLVFRCNNKHLEHLLSDSGIDVLEDHLVILTREIYTTGRSICRINDRVVTLSLVKKISKYLIDIHGQHTHQSLLYSENHIEILDTFDEINIRYLAEQVASKFYELKEFKNKLIDLCGDEKERERKKDLLRFQLDEIDACELKLGEEETLVSELGLLSNGEKILNIMSGAYEKLYNGNSQQASIIDHIGSIIRDLEDIKNLDENIENIFNVLQESLYSVEDVSRDIRTYRDNIEFDPFALEQVEIRLNLVTDMKRKYGNTIEEILEYREKIALELDEIENNESIVEELNKKIDESKKEFLELAVQLSTRRKLVALRLEKRMMKELASLNMDKVVFKVNFIESVEEENIFTAKGIDKIEFLISTNAGEPLKPLSKIASGGEMSRIMLAFKTILAKSDRIPTLIFDEIDSGISGRAANIVGEKLALISRTHQILCITHSPQIALMADQHFYIEKKSENNKTLTYVRKLENADRVKELGRLLGGVTLTDLTIEHAEEMLKLGEEFKRRLK